MTKEALKRKMISSWIVAACVGYSIAGMIHGIPVFPDGAIVVAVMVLAMMYD